MGNRDAARIGILANLTSMNTLRPLKFATERILNFSNFIAWSGRISCYAAYRSYHHGQSDRVKAPHMVFESKC
jgi:hypothetical protein